VDGGDDLCENCSENWHQVKLFHWAHGEEALGRISLAHLGAIPNGGRQIRWGTIRNYRDLGFRSGMPDIYFLLPRGGYHGMFIELKSMKKSTRTSPNQRQMHRMLLVAGYMVRVCAGYKNAINAVNEYCNFANGEDLPWLMPTKNH
jgi:hypothetical protein